MKISELSQYLNKLDSTTKRLEITSILADLIRVLDTDEVDKAIYLCLGYLSAPYESIKFNMADKMMVRVLESAYGIPKTEVEKAYIKLGDLGDVAFELSTNKKASNLEIYEVHTMLVSIAESEGAGSQETKVRKASDLLKKLDNLTAKFVTRMILGTTRLGFTELTVIDAISQATTKNTSLSEKIESVYGIYPDIGLIAKKIKESGIDGIKNIKIKAGVPILSQRCQRLSEPSEVIEKMGRVWAEFKFDGTRVQLHMDRNITVKSKKTDQESLFSSNEKKILVKTYTRNLEETTDQYPDLTDAAIKQLKADSIVLDGEAIGFNKETGEFLPFQEIMQRKRKHGIAEAAKEIPLKYFVFDILYLDGKSLINEPLEERRKILKNVVKDGPVIEVDSHIETDEVETLEDFFEQAKEKHLEGLVIKKPDSKYQAGARSFSWVKLKKMDTKRLEDTIDGVILGYWSGKGMRTELGMGKFLVGVYDEKTDTFKSFTKVGTGLKEDDLISIKKKLDQIKLKEKPANVEVEKKFIPDNWVKPSIIVEIGGDEISKSKDHSTGYALRFPRLIKLRPDKKAVDATTSKEIETLHNMQKRGYY